MTFEKGQMVVHPVHGAGTIIGINERRWRDNVEQYYVIELVGDRKSRVMLPVSQADQVGLRRAAQESELEEMWDALAAESEALPRDHRARYAQLKDKLREGDMVQTAEILRDLASRRRRNGRLSVRSKRLYREALRLLAGEVAAAEGVDPDDAELEVRTQLRKQASTATTTAA